MKRKISRYTNIAAGKTHFTAGLHDTGAVKVINNSIDIFTITLHFLEDELTIIRIGRTNCETQDVQDYSLMQEEELFQHSCTANHDVYLCSKLIKYIKRLNSFLDERANKHEEYWVEL